MKHSQYYMRRLSCKEAECDGIKNGWEVILSETSHAKMIEYLRAGKTGREFDDGIYRHYMEVVRSPGLIAFRFPANQPCFQKHTQRDGVFNISRVDTGARPLVYPDGDAFIMDSDSHLRKLKEAYDG